MLASYKWLCALAGFEPKVDELVRRFTFSGLEIASVRHRRREFDGLVVGRIVHKEPHAHSDHLSVVQVEDGETTRQVVCGASNCPGPGGLVVLALPGATVGDMTIAERPVAGVPSAGMLCSEAELDIGPDDSGILVLSEGTPGTPLVDALQLEDWILEIEVTPNRPDALSHRGLAREMCVLFGRPFTPPPPPDAPVDAERTADAVSVTIEAPARGRRYSALVMRGVQVAPSPSDLRYRLHNLGVRPISNIVDVTNLVLLEYGQPMHAFDLDKLDGPCIAVRVSAPGERLVTLDGKERVLDDDLVICDASKPVALAGVMGGQESEVSAATRDILLESAYFDPSTVRRTAKRHKLSSESSYRFERGIDYAGTVAALEAAAGTIASLAGGRRTSDVVDAVGDPLPERTAVFRPQRFFAVMGHEVSDDEAARILEGIGCGVDRSDAARWQVRIPFARPDIEREIDLIEEVARISGMDAVAPVLPRIQSQPPQRPEFDAIRRIKEILAGCGLQEAITYAFVDEHLLRAVLPDAPAVRIANPLNAEKAVLRPTLLVGLLDNLKRATARYQEAVAQFEVARVFADRGGPLPEERVHVGILMYGPRPGWPGEGGGDMDFYDLRSVLETVAHRFCAAPLRCVPADDPGPAWHPKRAATAYVGEKAVGTAGELHPTLLADLKLRPGAVFAELRLDDLRAAAQAPKVPVLSEFPPMTRDVAFVVSDAVCADDIQQELWRHCGPWAHRVAVFDRYTGSPLPDGHCSLAFRITYQATDRTLTDAQVDAAHQQAVRAVCDALGITTR